MPKPYEASVPEHCLSMVLEHCLSNALRTYGRTHVTTTHLARKSHLAYRVQGGKQEMTSEMEETPDAAVDELEPNIQRLLENLASGGEFNA